jgi:3-isopropylmalate/(R)-2-methylmalate dehydratase small subunit
MPLDRQNVDTDQIIPQKFLKRIERSGFGEFLFNDWRQDPGFVFNRPERQGASVLVAGTNFGCGSSREHAAWALEDAGYRVVVAPSFGDIFRNNCTKIGILPVVLSEAECTRLMEIAQTAPQSEATVDLVDQVVRAPGFEARFEIDPFTKDCLLNGWDDVALVGRHEGDIAAYEAGRPGWLPRLSAAG